MSELLSGIQSEATSELRNGPDIRDPLSEIQSESRSDTWSSSGSSKFIENVPLGFGEYLFPE